MSLKPESPSSKDLSKRQRISLPPGAEGVIRASRSEASEKMDKSGAFLKVGRKGENIKAPLGQPINFDLTPVPLDKDINKPIGELDPGESMEEIEDVEKTSENNGLAEAVEEINKEWEKEKSKYNLSEVPDSKYDLGEKSIAELNLVSDEEEGSNPIDDIISKR